MIIGTCGNCGGPVESDMEGVGRCKRCGATVQNTYGRRIPMNPPPSPYRDYERGDISDWQNYRDTLPKTFCVSQ